jgi:hypothetical protein
MPEKSQIPTPTNSSKRDPLAPATLTPDGKRWRQRRLIKLSGYSEIEAAVKAGVK